ncbi:hypothetical protein L2E82_30053 [Cichorium intybus]|uniref:Uncharacterized protein n=1 Tax=Cichorium intybus TaxID=13427 RepID=A0ACB9CZ56_CICIN|nr:hypothetical protein L2E82_30053 [Cichorium intybus]
MHEDNAEGIKNDEGRKEESGSDKDDKGSEDDSLFLDFDEDGSEFSSDEEVGESLGGAGKKRLKSRKKSRRGIREESNPVKASNTGTGNGSYLKVDTPNKIKGVSDKMQFLLSRSTPLKEKLEKLMVKLMVKLRV